MALPLTFRLFLLVSTFALLNGQIESPEIGFDDISIRTKTQWSPRSLQEFREPEDINLRKAAIAAFRATNSYRKSKGVAELEWSEALHRGCLKQVYRRAAFGNSANEGLAERFKQLPFNVTGGAENVALHYNARDPGGRAVEMWIADPTTHAPIVWGKFHAIGTAVIWKAASRRFYACQWLVSVPDGNVPATALLPPNAPGSLTALTGSTEKRDEALAAFQAINAFAAANKLRELKWSDELYERALERAVGMWLNRTIDLAAAVRPYESLSFEITGYNEITGSTMDPNRPGESFVGRWLRTPKEYGNIIEEFDTVAVAVVEGGNKRIYVCQMLVGVSK